MEANELRIGNYFQVKYGDNYKLDEVWSVEQCGINGDGNMGYDYNIDVVEGIPLTEEWLEDFGFISNPYQDRYEKEGFHIHCDKTKGFLDLWVTNCRLDLKQVHQLQNLYFALTGEELTKEQ